MDEILLPVLGAALLLLLFYDLLITVFHPRGHGGPLNRLVGHSMWKLFRRLGHRPRGIPNHSLLSYCGPAVAVLTIVGWTLLLIASFALIYYPFAEAFSTSPGTVEASWVKALYYSGYTASTLGIGDVVAPTPALRLLTVMEAMIGFIVFSMSVSYVIAVYRELGASSALALDLAGYFRRGARAALHDARCRESSSFAYWVDQTTRELLQITQSHAQYPIIHYFHFADPDQALPVQLGYLIALLGEVERMADQSDTEFVLTASSRDALRTALQAHLYEINTHVIPSRFRPASVPDDGSLRAQYQRMLRYFLYVGREAD